MMVFLIVMAVIRILSFGVIVYSLAVMASKTDELMAMINDERNVENENLKQDGIPINFNIASIGAVNYSVACPRELLKTSILSNAASMIILHNHPSGSLKASKDDILMTNKMEKICEQIGIPLRDHIIVAPGRVDYFSFRKENMIGSNLIQTIADGKEKAR